MLAWMAWTWPTALFFLAIFLILCLFTFLAIRYPETPRRGALGIETTRGDRLFIALLAIAFILLGFIYFEDVSNWWGVGVAAIVTAAIFRWV